MKCPRIEVWLAAICVWIPLAFALCFLNRPYSTFIDITFLTVAIIWGVAGSVMIGVWTK